jgi:hypothetical protein
MIFTGAKGATKKEKTPLLWKAWFHFVEKIYIPKNTKIGGQMRKVERHGLNLARATNRT